MDLGSQIRRQLGFFLLLLKLLWSELSSRRKATISFNKAAARCCRLVELTWRVGLFPLAGSGSEGRESSSVLISVSRWRGECVDVLGGDGWISPAGLRGEGRKNPAVFSEASVLMGSW